MVSKAGIRDRTFFMFEGALLKSCQYKCKGRERQSSVNPHFLTIVSDHLFPRRKSYYWHKK